MDTLKGVLKTVLKDLMKQGKGHDLDGASAAWKRIVGEAAAAHSDIVYLTKDKIRVNVNSSAWLYQLNLKKAAIERELYKTLKIKDVTLRLGDIKTPGRKQPTQPSGTQHGR
jgi:predicted nucleic acid-binding Zn ribbon protein